MKSPFRWLTAVLPLCLLLTLAWTGGAATATRAWSTSLSYSFEASESARFDKGLLLAYGYRTPRISAWDRSGKLLLQTNLYIPMADQITVSDVAARPQGGLVVAGTALNWEGPGGAFLAWLSPAGTVERVVRTSPFAALQICVSADGSIWGAGRELQPDDRSRMRYVPDHPVLRHFDPAGKLLRSALPRGVFASAAHPVQPRSRIACGDGRVGLYSLSANEWIEVSHEGAILGRWKGVPLAPGTDRTGIGLLPDGSLYQATVVTLPGKTSRTEMFRLDRSAHAWRPVAFAEDVLGSGRSRHFAEIIGADGAAVVIHAARQADIVALRAE